MVLGFLNFITEFIENYEKLQHVHVDYCRQLDSYKMHRSYYGQVIIISVQVKNINDVW